MSDTKHSYTVDLDWKKQRMGILHSEVLEDELRVATPPEFPGGMEGIWSPEHLFVASVSSCFMTTFLAIAEMSKLDFDDLKVSATGLMDKPDGKYEITEIEIRASLHISDENKKDKAERILQKAEENCLITRSIRSTVQLTTDISIS